MTPLLQALIAAGGTLLGSAIPLVWAIQLERRCRRLNQLLRESNLQRLALQDEVNRWRALYYDERNVDVQSRRTQLMHPSG